MDAVGMLESKISLWFGIATDKKLTGFACKLGQSLILCKPQIRLQNDNIIYVVFVV